MSELRCKRLMLSNRLALLSERCDMRDALAYGRVIPGGWCSLPWLRSLRGAAAPVLRISECRGFDRYVWRAIEGTTDSDPAHVPRQRLGRQGRRRRRPVARRSARHVVVTARESWRAAVASSGR